MSNLLVLVAVSAALVLSAGLAAAHPSGPGAQTPDPSETVTPEPTVDPNPPIDDLPIEEDPESEAPPVEDPPPRSRPRGERAPAGLCPPVKPGEHCGPGNGRRTGGGGDKVSHKGWPAVTGVFFIVQRRGGRHSFTGTKLNDEILGYDGHDTLAGGRGKDILWGD